LPVLFIINHPGILSDCTGYDRILQDMSERTDPVMNDTPAKRYLY
jgi:hypothetical protein